MYNILLQMLLKRPGAGYLLFWGYRGIIIVIVIIITIISLASQTALGGSRGVQEQQSSKSLVHGTTFEALAASRDDGGPGLQSASVRLPFCLF